MSSASSNQSSVREGLGYNEVFPSGHKDLDTSSEERNPSSSLPSSDEDLEMDGSEGDSNDGLVGAEPPIKSVVGPDELKKFIMLPL